MVSQGTSVSVISDGTLMIDGGTLFGQVAKTEWETKIKPDRKNRVRIAINTLLVETPTKNILIDVGAGSKRPEKLKDKYGLNGNKLLRGLKNAGLTARDIDAVVLTHLHFDNAGGSTKLDRSGNAVATFPKAEYFVQSAAWEEANNPNERSSGLYNPDDFVPIEKSGLLKLIDGECEIGPGVRTKFTGGHTEGHQVVLIEAGSERLVFTGGLIPTHQHIASNTIASFDQSPNQTLSNKKEIVDMAIAGGWLFIFGNSFEHRAGYVQQRNGLIEFSPKDI